MSRRALARFAFANNNSSPPSPPPMLLSPSNHQHPPPPEPFPRSPTASVFAVPNMYSSSTPLVYGFHPRSICYPLHRLRLYTRNERGGDYGRRAICVQSSSYPSAPNGTSLIADNPHMNTHTHTHSILLCLLPPTSTGAPLASRQSSSCYFFLLYPTAPDD